jgi:hypothetical protein
MLEGGLCRDTRMQPPRSLCCKFEQLVLNAFEGTSSLTDARNLEG